MWPLHMSWIILTLVTTTNTQIHANYVHLTSPQQCVKYTDFSKSKFRSYDPWNKFQNILTLASIAISLYVRYTRTSTISYSSTHVTAALHSALLPHQYVKYIVTNYNNNTHSIQCECFTSKYTQIILSQFTYPCNNTCDIFQ